MTALADLITRDRRPTVSVVVSVEFAGKRRPIAAIDVRFSPDEPPAEIGRAIDEAFAAARAAIKKELDLP